MKRHTPLLLAGVLALGLGGAGIGRAAVQHQHASDPTAPAHYTVIAGWGDNYGAANIFTPATVEIYPGDTVTWKVGGTLEPHTVTFGPMAMLTKLAANITVVMPQKAGPPIIALNPQAAFPTRSTTYDGTGFANSGFLQGKGKTWSLTFTTPGTYKYYCLIHYDTSPGGLKMSGTVIVNPRPAASHVYNVNAGLPSETALSAVDGFNPRALTIHVGDSVVWHGFFHTVTFGPEALLTSIEQNFVIPVPQKNGPPLLTINPKAALPSGGNTYDGTGFLNSGIMTALAKGNEVPSFKVTFTKAGTYDYDCLVHPHMDGTITVLP
jgi:plastocyanin